MRLFPRDMRATFGDDMHEFVARRRAAVRGRAAVWLWIRLMADAMRHGVGARWDRLPARPFRRPMTPLSSRWSMESVVYDLHHALRTFLRQPGLSAAILLTLALGVGANTAVFSVLHAVLLRPLPFPQPDRLVMVWEKRPGEGVFDNVVSPADYLDWVRRSTSFTGLAAHTTATADLTGVGEPVQLRAAGVTSGFFDVLGVRPLHGRVFAPGEDTLGRHRVALVSFGLWRDRLGSDPHIVGRSLQLNDVPHEVIGVLPREFTAGLGERTPTPGEMADIWAPLVLQNGSEAPARASHFLSVYARLKPGVSVEAARDEMDRIGAQLSAEYPAENRNHGAHLVPLRERIVGPARNGLLIVMSAVAFLLLIACTNVANLLLARGAGRRREMAIRSAIGAARTRLLRQTLTESLALSTLGGLIGLPVAWWTIRWLVSEMPPALRSAGLERAQLDVPVLLFTSVVCLVVGLIVGMVPAWRGSSDGDTVGPLREGGRSPASLRRSVRTTLIVTQIALTALLLVGAGLMLRSLARVLAQPTGLATANRLTVTLTLPRARYANPDAVRRARRALDDRFNGIPGVIAAGANNNLPLTGSDARQGIVVEGYERSADDPPTRANTRIVTPRYFAAAGIALLEGRGFAASDDARSPFVVVINDTMARRYWRGRSAVGQRVRFTNDERWRQVVGVIADVRHWGLDREVSPELYMSHDQQPSSTLSYVLHTTGDPLSIVPVLKSHVAAVDPALPVGDVRTMDDVSARSVAARRWSAMLLGLFALLGTCLAGAGIYGVMTHVVALRTGEIGIRMTLGARPARMLQQVLGETLAHAAIGLAIGLGLAYVAAPLIAATLFEVRAADPVAFLGTGVVVFAVATAAALIPALRAMRVDPAQALNR
jgi:putative ABC transport system permease protein